MLHKNLGDHQNNIKVEAIRLKLNKEKMRKGVVVNEVTRKNNTKGIAKVGKVELC